MEMLQADLGNIMAVALSYGFRAEQLDYEAARKQGRKRKAELPSELDPAQRAIDKYVVPAPRAPGALPAPISAVPGALVL